MGLGQGEPVTFQVFKRFSYPFSVFKIAALKYRYRFWKPFWSFGALKESILERTDSINQTEFHSTISSSCYFVELKKSLTKGISII